MFHATTLRLRSKVRPIRRWRWLSYPTAAGSPNVWWTCSGSYKPRICMDIAQFERMSEFDWQISR